MDQFDDLLASELGRVAGTAAVWPDPVARVHGAAARARRRLALVATACLLVTAAGVAAAVPRHGASSVRPATDPLRVPVTTPVPVATETPVPTESQPPPPYGPGIQIGKEYRYTLYTHCGIEYAYFDGRAWHTDANPPAGLDQSLDGIVVLTATDRAEFRPDRGGTFVYAPANPDPPMCV